MAVAVVTVIELFSMVKVINPRIWNPCNDISLHDADTTLMIEDSILRHL